MLVIDPDSPTPPFEQVRSQLAGLISSRELLPGARLPTVRRLAGDLGIAPNTVARAYRELEAASLIETRGRAGTFVAAGEEVDVRAREAAATFADVCRSLGVPAAEALRLASDALGVAPGATDGSAAPAAGS